MSKLRSSAKGQKCQVRIPGVCNFNPETTVLAHLNGGGMAIKHHDLHGAFCCSECHRMIDGEYGAYRKDAVKLMHLEGIIRTQKIWLRDGLIKA